MADRRREVVRRPGAADAALTPAPVRLAHNPRRSRCEDETRAPQGALAVATPTRETHEGLDEAAGPSLFQDTD